MSRITRRRMIGTGFGAAAAAAALRPVGLWAAPPAGFDAGLKPIGKVRPVRSVDVEASPLGVGFEVLDRRRFDPKRAYPHLAELGVKWARCQTGWNRCETTPGEYSFAWLDGVVDSLLEIGIQPWFNLGYGNKLYTPEKPDDISVGWAPIFDERAKAAWLRFVGKLAEHFRDRVRHWEIWNEPNIRGFWKPREPNPADYVTMVEAAAPVIRRAVPDAVLIGGAFAGIPMRYIEGCLEAGLAKHVDKISYHPYRPEPENRYDQEIAALRKLIAEHDPAIEIWQGENGCPSVGGPGTDSVGAMTRLPWNETAQARWLTRRILTDLRLGVEHTSYFHTVDLVGYRGKTNYKGLLRGKDYTRKPAFGAYQCLCALFDAQSKRHPALVVELVGAEKVRLQEAGFARGGRGMLAYWYPAKLLDPWQARPLSMKIPAPADAMIDDPVLIDPLSQQVFKIPRAKRTRGGVVCEGLPLMNYPLIVADARLVT